MANEKAGLRLVQRISKYLIPTLTGAFVLLFLIRESAYKQVTKEDHLVEWLTFYWNCNRILEAFSQAALVAVAQL